MHKYTEFSDMYSWDKLATSINHTRTFIMVNLGESIKSEQIYLLKEIINVSQR